MQGKKAVSALQTGLSHKTNRPYLQKPHAVASEIRNCQGRTQELMEGGVILPFPPSLPLPFPPLPPPLSLPLPPLEVGPLQTS